MMTKSISHATTTCAHKPLPQMYKGVMIEKADSPCVIALLPIVTLTGIMTTIPSNPKVKNIFLNMRVKRRKTTASRPIFSIKKSSVALLTGLIQLNNPLPRGGGACCLSEFFSLGAYTSAWRGRIKQKSRARPALTPREVAREAQKAFVCSYQKGQLFSFGGGHWEAYRCLERIGHEL